MSSLARLRSAVAAAVRPRKRLSVSDWADRFRMLDSRSSAEPGKWRTSRTPYLKEILDICGPADRTEDVVLMFASQVGKSELLNNCVGYYVDEDPCPILMVQPTEQAAERYSRQRIGPMIEASPVLRAKVADVKSRDGGNTLLAKEFTGGIFVLVGANSPVGLASMPARILLLDELDRFPKELGKDGDPVGQAERRTATFRRRKRVKVSTPTVRKQSRIEFEFLAGDQRHFEVPCPHCGTYQRLEWSGVKWPKGQPRRAQYECSHCGELISEAKKPWILERGRWTAEHPDVAEGKRLAHDEKEPVVAKPGVRSYHLSALYSPWVTWAEMAVEFTRAAKDPVLLRIFVNLYLGQTWSHEDGDTVDENDLLARRELFPEKVPAAVGLVTAGVDVQSNRVEVEIVGWGAGEESWSLDYVVMYGDPSVDPKAGGIWTELDEVLKRRFVHELGADVGIDAVCIDTGHQANNVYAFVKPRQSRRVWGVKGKSNDFNAPVWPRSPSRRNKGGIDLFVVGVDAAKETIYARLRVTDPGPGYCHFPADRAESYFAGLTAERLRVRYHRGFEIREWVKKSGAANEPLDLRVYAYAALHGLKAAGRTIERALDRLKTRRDPADQPDRKHESVRRRGWLGRRRDHWIG